MTSLADSPDFGAPAQHVPDEDGGFVGVVTRAVSWILDAIAINVVATVSALGAQVVFSVFPVSRHAASTLKPIAGAIYLVWCLVYFVAFWWWTGQTLGARIMQIRLVTAKGGRVHPVRGLVRWVGMNLAMIPLFAGYLPIPFGRHGFPDWLARTQVIDVTQPSLAAGRQAAMRQARDGSRQAAPAISSETQAEPSALGDGSGSPPVRPREPSLSESRE